MIRATPERLLRALYDGALGVAFLITWISPFALGDDTYDWLNDVLPFQGVIVVLTTVLLYRVDINEPSGIVVAVVVAALALVAFLADPDFRSFGLLVPFIWHLYSLYSLANSSMPTIERRKQTTFSFWSVVFMTAAAMIVVTFPVPKLGWKDLPVSPALEAAGIDPYHGSHVFLAWGTLYFLPMAFLKYRWRVGWPVPRFRKPRRSP